MAEPQVSYRQVTIPTHVACPDCPTPIPLAVTLRPKVTRGGTPSLTVQLDQRAFEKQVIEHLAETDQPHPTLGMLEKT